MYVLMSDCGIPMFTGTLTELTEDQLALIYWIKFYNHHVYSIDETDRPAEYIVEYDCLFDEYLDNKHFKDKLSSKRGVQFANNMDTVIEF